MTAFAEGTARVWCHAFARTLDHQEIRRSHDRPYLERYYAAGWDPIRQQPGPAIFLHHFVASDEPDLLHSHPWGWSVSLILVGGYREQRCGPDGRLVERAYRPGDVNVLAADDRHRIDLLASDCWTLFLAGAVEKSWSFVPRC